MYMDSDYDGDTFEGYERERLEAAERREEEREEQRARELELEMSYIEPGDDLMLEIANGWAASVIRTQRSAA